MIIFKIWNFPLKSLVADHPPSTIHPVLHAWAHNRALSASVGVIGRWEGIFYPSHPKGQVSLSWLPAIFVYTSLSLSLSSGSCVWTRTIHFCFSFIYWLIWITKREKKDVKKHHSSTENTKSLFNITSFLNPKAWQPCLVAQFVLLSPENTACQPKYTTGLIQVKSLPHRN